MKLSKELVWLETKHFLPERGEIVLLAWTRVSGNTYRTGRFTDGRFMLTDNSEPREKPMYFAVLQ